MSAIVGQDWRPKTTRELFIQWQAVLLERWHHTAHIKMMNSNGKSSYSDLHPYIEEVKKMTTVAIRPKPIFSLDEDEDYHEQAFI